MLDELRHNTAPGDQVDHADVGHPYHPLGYRVGDARDPVDHHEGVADDRGLNRCRAAGDHTGAGVMEGLAGVGDEVEVGERGGGRGLAGLEGDPAGDELPEPPEAAAQIFGVGAEAIRSSRRSRSMAVRAPTASWLS